MCFGYSGRERGTGHTWTLEGNSEIFCSDQELHDEMYPYQGGAISVSTHVIQSDHPENNLKGKY